MIPRPPRATLFPSTTLLRSNRTGTGYTLTASASGFASVISTAFDITPGTATQLAFTGQPTTTVAGVVISPAVQVTALDPAGNPSAERPGGEEGGSRW